MSLPTVFLTGKSADQPSNDSLESSIPRKLTDTTTLISRPLEDGDIINIDITVSNRELLGSLSPDGLVI